MRRLAVMAGLPSARQILSAQDGAELAARLANDQCKRLFGRQPFSPGQHSAMLEDGLYHWGKLDVAGLVVIVLDPLTALPVTYVCVPISN